MLRTCCLARSVCPCWPLTRSGSYLLHLILTHSHVEGTTTYRSAARKISDGGHSPHDVDSHASVGAHLRVPELGAASNGLRLRGEGVIAGTRLHHLAGVARLALTLLHSAPPPSVPRRVSLLWSLLRALAPLGRGDAAHAPVTSALNGRSRFFCEFVSVLRVGCESPLTFAGRWRSRRGRRDGGRGSRGRLLCIPALETSGVSWRGLLQAGRRARRAPRRPRW